MGHLAKNIPYNSTYIAYGASKNDIEEMLKEAGAVALRWTETPDSMKGAALPVLEFIFPIEWKGVEKHFMVQVKPPLLVTRKRINRQMVETPNRNASMRLAYWYLKTKLEAIKFGMDDVFTAFMSRVINQLPDGTTMTLGETITEHPEVLQGLLPSFDIKPRQLESRESEVVDGTVMQ